MNALLVTKGSLAEFKRHHAPKKKRKKKEEEGGTELGLAVGGVLLCFLAPWCVKPFHLLSAER